MTNLLNPENRLFALARQGKRLPSGLAAVGIVLATLVMGIIPGQVLTHFAIRLLPSGKESMAGPIIQNVAIFSAIYLALWAWVRFFARRPFRTLGLDRPHAFQDSLRGAFVAGLMLAVTAGLAIAAGASFAPGLLQTMGLGALGIRFLSLLGYLIQGSAEEVLFRGWLLPVLGARYRPLIGLLLSSLIFSLAHATSRGITPLGFLNLFLFGVFAAVYALAERGLWGIGVWHAVWNWSMGDLLGFALDGTPHFGLLSTVRTDGPWIVTGGAFGLEGGLCCTAVFLIAITVITMQNRVPQTKRCIG